jgi:hypothetical protein
LGNFFRASRLATYEEQEAPHLPDGCLAVDPAPGAGVHEAVGAQRQDAREGRQHVTDDQERPHVRVDLLTLHHRHPERERDDGRPDDGRELAPLLQQALEGAGRRTVRGVRHEVGDAREPVGDCHVDDKAEGELAKVREGKVGRDDDARPNEGERRHEDRDPEDAISLGSGE